MTKPPKEGVKRKSDPFFFLTPPVLTRSGQPFTACGKCGARTLYNSRIAIQILKRHMRELKKE